MCLKMAASLGNKVHLNSVVVKVQQNGEEKIIIEDIHGKKYQVHKLVYSLFSLLWKSILHVSPNNGVVK